MAQFIRTPPYISSSDSTKISQVSLALDNLIRWINQFDSGINSWTNLNAQNIAVGSGTTPGVTSGFVSQVTTGVSTSAKVILSNPTFFNFCFIAGNDGSGNLFADVILMSVGTGTVNVISSLSALGSPATRTYAQSSSTLKLTMGSGTYTVKVLSISLS